MSKKPFVFIFIGLVLICVPFFMLGQAIFYFHHSPFEIIEIFSKLTMLNILIMLLSIITGYLIMMADIKGFYLFPLLSLTVLINNTLVFMGPKMHSLWWIIGSTVFFVGMNLFIMQNKYYRLFVNPKLKWWRTSPRFNKNFKIMLVKGRDRFEARTIDISKTGAFISDSIDVEVGDRFNMNLYLNNIAVVKGECEVVRKGKGSLNNSGFGINFDNIGKTSKIIFLKHLDQMASAC